MDDAAEIHEKFVTLFAANEAAIRAYVRRLVPTRDDAADVMQGVALVLWRKFRNSTMPITFVSGHLVLLAFKRWRGCETRRGIGSY